MHPLGDVATELDAAGKVYGSLISSASHWAGISLASVWRSNGARECLRRGAELRERKDAFGHRVAHSDAHVLQRLVLLGLGIMAAGIARLIALDCAAGEIGAAILCYLALLLGGIPSLLVCVNALAPGRLSRRLCELCAVWLLWNGGWLVYLSMLWPFLMCSVATRFTLYKASYGDILYDFAVFVSFIAFPVVLCSGILKVISVKMSWRWGWQQRAGLGASLVLATLCTWAGQLYFRPQAFGVTVVLSLGFYMYTVLTFLPPLLRPTAPGPEVSGRRQWLWMRSLLHTHILHLAISYFDLTVRLDRPFAPVGAGRKEQGEGVRGSEKWPGGAGGDGEGERGVGGGAGDGDGEAGALGAMMMGFHPHGIIPVAAGLMSLTAGWRRYFGELVPCMMIDFMIHLIPVWRDVVQWVGAREVSREAIGAVLKEEGTCIVVPGGQAEIALARSWGNEVFFLKSHKGFVRAAMQHRARLVPVVSFGEWELLDNISMPRVQNWTRSILGFPIPFWPVGVWYAPLPRRPSRGLTIVIGEPVEYDLPAAAPGGSSVTADGPRQEPSAAAGDRVPSAAEVDDCHARYFAQVIAIVFACVFV